MLWRYIVECIGPSSTFFNDKSEQKNTELNHSRQHLARDREDERMYFVSIKLNIISFRTMSCVNQCRALILGCASHYVNKAIHNIMHQRHVSFSMRQPNPHPKSTKNIVDSKLIQTRMKCAICMTNYVMPVDDNNDLFEHICTWIREKGKNRVFFLQEKAKIKSQLWCAVWWSGVTWFQCSSSDWMCFKAESRVYESWHMCK